MTTNGLKISEMKYSTIEDAVNNNAQVPVSVDINGVKANRRVPIQLIKGYQGVQGVQGNQGNSIVGPQGNQGASIVGSQGASIVGPQGDQGASIVGPQGNQGDQGTSITSDHVYPIEYYGPDINSVPYTFTAAMLSNIDSGGLFKLDPVGAQYNYPVIIFDPDTVLPTPIGFTLFILIRLVCGGDRLTLTMTNVDGETASCYIENPFDDECLRVIRIVRCLSGWAVM